MITRPKLSSLIPAQVPEFVREDYTTFVDFLKAYYEFLDENYNTDFTTLRDLDKTLDSFIDHFKNELAVNIPYSVVNERFLLEKIKDQYLAKGSEASFKLLFKILFDKQVTIDYPSKQILRASDGKWNQDVSLFAEINAGDPEDIVGKIVDVVSSTTNRILRVQVDKRQYVEIEVDNVVQISDTIYEFFIDRRFFGDINVGDKLKYSDTFEATIVPTTSSVELQQAGKKFRVGELYDIVNGQGTGSTIKIKRVNSIGGIEAVEFVKYGVGYASDFTATLYPYSDRPPEGSQLSFTSTKVDDTTSIIYSEPTSGFYEQGTINYLDYAVQTQQEIDDQGPGLVWDGTYNGVIVREFFVDNKSAVLDPESPAVIKIILKALAKYPGYYTTNDGFLDDAIFIQDSRYYQAFAYVIKIDERLSKYRSAVKTLIHPAGMALFGEFDIRNEFDSSTELEFVLRYLVFALQDELQTNDSSTMFISKNITGDEDDTVISISEVGSGSGRTVPYIGMDKILDSTTTNYDEIVEVQEVIPLDEVGSGSSRTVPYADIIKPLSNHNLLDEFYQDDNTVSPTEDNYLNADGLTYRKGISEYTIGKILNSTAYDHYLNNGSTLDDDTVTPAETIGPFDITKPLNAHKLNDNITDDDNTIAPSDTTGSNSTRTVPYIVLNKSIDSTTTNYDEVVEIHEAIPTDSGGALWLNAYTNPYPITNSYFLNDSGNYTEGESTFTG